jgi:hypothetical protein
MEGRESALVEKLQRLLREAAEVSLELEKAEGRWEARPHYTSIEARAHELGQQLSRQVQQRRMAELVAESPPTAKCPSCGTRCETRPHQRTVASIDGSVQLLEQRGECPVCRRAFFPSAGELGL